MQQQRGLIVCLTRRRTLTIILWPCLRTISLTESLRFKCANDLFSRKQLPDESVDDYETQMRKSARLIEVDDKILQLILVNGFKPWISAQVTQAKPESVDRILEVASLAELTAPKVTTTDVHITEQLVDLQAELRRLSMKIDNASVTTVHPRLSTEDQHLHFIRLQSAQLFTPTPGRRAQFNYQQSVQPFIPKTTYVPQDHYRHDEYSRLNAPLYNSNQPQQAPNFNEQRKQGLADGPQSQPPTGTCTRCARNHGRNSFCQARDPTKVCNFCHKRGHFKAACFSAQKYL